HKVCRPRVLVDKQTGDAHDNPVITLDDGGRVWVFSSAHGRSRPAYIWRGVEPHSIDAFERVSDWNYSYPQPWWIGGEGFCFLHTRYAPPRHSKGWLRALYCMTSRDGRDWSEPKQLAAIEKGHYQISWRRGERIATAFNVHPFPEGLDYRTNLYYMQTTDFGRSWQTTSGQNVQTPLIEIDNPALVHDFRAEGRLVYMKDINFDAEGNPIILVVTSWGWTPGPADGPRIWTTAHWSGGRWRIGGSIESDSNYDTGCLHVADDGVWRIIAPTDDGPQPFNPGGEMVLWTSKDQGNTWRRTRQITSTSEFNHTYARRPVNAADGFYAFWADGHGRRQSESRLYFCNAAGDAFRLPEQMRDDWAKCERIN
ncbi:MAG: BNR-4 repeat-containing protein, partial [Planctomycetes bacterium]|nr:BNR-4 repeat-containing protein [Planctomycetota bacterium]